MRCGKLKPASSAPWLRLFAFSCGRLRPLHCGRRRGGQQSEQTIHTRQHFPRSNICLPQDTVNERLLNQASEQNIELITTDCSDRRLRRRLRAVVSAFERTAGPAAEGIDPCHSLVGNLNEFSAAEILQMSCLSQRSGRFTFKSGRGNSEIYLHHGLVRHAVYGPVEGEPVIAEVFRWRQGRFYFEEGIISQVQTVTRPWAHLLIDNLQKLDETSAIGQRRGTAMRDTTLETQLRLLILQTESWKKLHDFITYALDKSKPIISAEQEHQFTEIRSILLQEIGHAFKELNLVAELSGKAMNVLQRASSIRGVRELFADETRRLESDWNAVFTRLGVVGASKGTPPGAA